MHNILNTFKTASNRPQHTHRQFWIRLLYVNTNLAYKTKYKRFLFGHKYVLPQQIKGEKLFFAIRVQNVSILRTIQAQQVPCDIKVPSSQLNPLDME